MSTKIIVSYDGTANEDDAIALGRLFGGAGAEVSLAYVRHTHETDSEREEIAQAEAEELLERGVELLGDPGAKRHVVTDRSTPRGLAALAEREGADVIVFCSDSHTAKGHVAIGNSAERLLEGGTHRDRDRARRPRRASTELSPPADRRGRRRRRRRARDRRGARHGARRDRRAGRQRADRPARDRLAPRRRAGSRLAQLLGLAPDRDRHAARCSCCRAASRSAFGAAAQRTGRRLSDRRTSAPRGGASARWLRRARAQAGSARAPSRSPASRRRGGPPGRSTATPRRAGWRRCVARAASNGTVSWRPCPPRLKTTVTELGDSRVRLQVQVPPGEVEGRLERKAQQLGRELKLPGFRRGKVPAPLVIQRVGREAVLEEAVRDTLSSWYSDAIESAGIVPVGDPQLDLGELPPQGQALEFSIEIGVLPKAELGDYKGLEVARREPEVADEQVEQEIEAMRERLARLETAERPAAAGDFVVVDYVGSLVPEQAEARAAARAVRRRRGPRPADRARLRQPDPGLRGRPARRERRRDAHGRADVPRGLRQRGARRARRVLRGRPSRRSSSRSCRRSTTTSRSTRASTISRSCARTSASGCSSSTRSGSTASSARRRSTRRSPSRR